MNCLTCNEGRRDVIMIIKNVVCVFACICAFVAVQADIPEMLFVSRILGGFAVIQVQYVVSDYLKVAIRPSYCSVQTVLHLSGKMGGDVLYIRWSETIKNV